MTPEVGTGCELDTLVSLERSGERSGLREESTESLKRKEVDENKIDYSVMFTDKVRRQIP